MLLARPSSGENWRRLSLWATERLGDELEARSKLLRVELMTAAGAKKTCVMVLESCMTDALSSWFNKHNGYARSGICDGRRHQQQRVLVPLRMSAVVRQAAQHTVCWLSNGIINECSIDDKHRHQHTGWLYYNILCAYIILGI